MFRSLATRLTATYVFGAIVLVVIVVAAVTGFALTMFGVSVRDDMQSVAREVPDVVRSHLARSGSLEAAAPTIVRELSRPGIRVVLFENEVGGHRRFLAATGPAGPDGRPIIIEGPKIVYMAPVVSVPGGISIAGSAVSGVPIVLAPPLPPDAEDGRVPVGPPDFSKYGGPVMYGPPSFNFGPAGPPPDQGRFEHMKPFPLGLDSFLRLAPVTVETDGGRVVMFPDPGPLGHTINMFWLAMIPIGIFVVVASWLIGRLITVHAMRPLVETTASLERFGAGDFTQRSIFTSERNEIGALVTAYNHAAAQVARALEERKVAEEQMRQFIADAGHELRTPLTVIMGFIDVLRRRNNDSPASAKIFDTMAQESRRMKELIEKLIVLARLENPPQRELETVDLAELADQVVTALSALRPAPKIALARNGASLVRGNESELHDALSNLVENAVKYAPDSPVDVRVGGENGLAVVDVIDRGPGIPAEEQSQVFERFYRGRDRTDAEGFGLGLAIAKRAVERAGGQITLASKPGEGSRFSIRIPLAPRTASPALAG